MLTILRLVEEGEVEQTPDPERRAAATNILKLASRMLRFVGEIDSEAATLIASGFKPFDALHFALVSCAKVEYFCTCDDKLRKKEQRLRSLKTTVVTPLELVMKVVP